MHQDIKFDVGRMQQDMAAKGWNATGLANHTEPRVAVSSVTRFLNGQHQTPRMAKGLANALGYSVRRYLVNAGRSEAVAS